MALFRTHCLAADADFERAAVGAEGDQPRVAVSDIAEDTRGRIWVATAGGGIAVREGDEWRWVGLGSGLSSPRVYSLLIDREDRL